jgi:phospholipid transport system substrate-binding protein
MILVWRMARTARYLAASLVLLLGILVLPDQALSDDKANQASEFIEDLSQQAVEALTEPNISRGERETRFRKLLGQHFAVTTIGQWVLGRYWKTATLEERKEFLSLFEDLLVVTYVNRFERYSGETLSVEKTLVDDKSGDAVVFSHLNRPDGAPVVSVGWRLRSKGESFKVVDVMVEGVSMGQTQRSEFASVIRKHGGRVRGLLAELRERVKGNA